VERFPVTIVNGVEANITLVKSFRSRSRSPKKRGCSEAGSIANAEGAEDAEDALTPSSVGNKCIRLGSKAIRSASLINNGED